MVEGTLSRYNVWDHLLCGGTFSSLLWAPLLLWPCIPPELWHRPPQFPGGDRGTFFSCGVATSGGSLWEGYSLYCGIGSFSLGFQRIMLCSSCEEPPQLTSGALSLFAAEGLLSRHNVPEGSASSFGRNFPLFGRSLLCLCRLKLLPCDSRGFVELWWGLGIPLELQQGRHFRSL